VTVTVSFLPTTGAGMVYEAAVAPEIALPSAFH
jgi:hypothetical protein